MSSNCYWTAGLRNKNRPKFGFGTQEEVMRVHEGFGRDGAWEMHVEVSDIQTDRDLGAGSLPTSLARLRASWLS